MKTFCDNFCYFRKMLYSYSTIYAMVVFQKEVSITCPRMITRNQGSLCICQSTSFISSYLKKALNECKFQYGAEMQQTLCDWFYQYAT
jgi:hypothetical protein